MATCTYGYYTGTNYINTCWLGINFTVIAISLVVIAAVYMVSRTFPGKRRTAIVEITKVEISQLAVSVIIIAVLIAVTASVQSIVQSWSTSLTGSSLQPIQFAIYYIGNLGYQKGITLLQSLYQTSINLQIDSGIFYFLSGFFGSSPSIIPKGFFRVIIEIGANMSIPLTYLSDLLVGLFSFIITVTTGMLFLQWILLPFIEATAFTIILPVGLIVRSISYIGTNQGLRTIANIFIAIAVAGYIVYPLTIAMDSYIVNWIYSPQDLSLSYLNMVANTVTDPLALPASGLSQATGNAGAGKIGGIFSTVSIGDFLKSADVGGLKFLEPWAVPNAIYSILVEMTQFEFLGVILMALNFGITIAFAMSLAKALDKGIEGFAQFW